MKISANIKKFPIQKTFLQGRGQATTFSQIQERICSQLKVSACLIYNSSSSLTTGGIN